MTLEIDEVYGWAMGVAGMDRQEYRVAGLSEPISHYTDAVRFGRTLHISGVAPLDSTGRVVSEDPAEQTEQIFRNMQLVLNEAGGSFAGVLKVTVFLTDISDRHLINPVRQRIFGPHRPASTLIEVKALAIQGMKVEIEAVVALPNE